MEESERWLKELSEKPKLASMLKMMADSGMESSCTHVRSRMRAGKMMIKL